MNATTDQEHTPEPSQPPNSADPPPPSQTSAPKSAELSVSSILATVECLTPDEQIQLLTCEEVIRMGWNSFVDVGLALATVRDGRLYKEQFDSFEQSCPQKWQYAPRRAYYLTSAAQIFRHLCTNCADREPDHESQLRRGRTGFVAAEVTRLTAFSQDHWTADFSLLGRSLGVPGSVAAFAG